MDPQLIANTLYSFLLLAVMAASFFFIFKPTGYFHVSHAATLVLGAYVYLYLQSIGANVVLSLAFALIAATSFGVANEIFLYRLIATRRDRGIQILVLSLGIYLIFQNLFSLTAGDEIRRITLCASCLNAVVSGAGVTFSSVQILAGTVSTLVLLALASLWYLTDFGRAARSISENTELASVVGIDVKRTIAIAVAVGSCAAGIVGLMIGIDVGVTPTLGFSYLLLAIIAVVIGGNQSLAGAIIGAFVLAAIQNLTGFFVESKWAPVFMYLLLITFLLFRPQGAGAIRQTVERR